MTNPKQEAMIFIKRESGIEASVLRGYYLKNFSAVLKSIEMFPQIVKGEKITSISLIQEEEKVHIPYF